MRSAVSTESRSGALKANETAVFETPASRATSAMRGRPWRRSKPAPPFLTRPPPSPLNRFTKRIGRAEERQDPSGPHNDARDESVTTNALGCGALSRLRAGDPRRGGTEPRL